MKRRDFIKGATATAAVSATQSLEDLSAWAQANRDTVISISESGANSMDPHTSGANRGAYEVAWNTCDRLLSFAMKKDENGVDHVDGSKLTPELAEEWNTSDLSTTFKLRRGATFHDGAPVTAKDVQWSFQRAIGAGGNAKFQVGVGGLVKPEQFVVLDDHTMRFDAESKSRLTLPSFGLPMPNILNSELIKKNATAADPWGLEWSKTNEAGGGAYKIVSRTPEQIAFVRHDGWKSGARPPAERVVWRVVPSASTRRALLERGDVDISNEFPPKDIAEMAKEGKLSVVATPIDAAVQFITMNVKMAPFDNVKVRQAVAYAIPYQKILDVALYGKARVLAGGPAKVSSAEWPQPSPYAYDLAKAKALLAEAGHPNGFETTFSFDAGSAGILEPMCILIQESLGQIGIKVTLDKISGANWRSAFGSKKLPFLTNLFAAFLEDQTYYFEFVFSKTSIFNSADYANAEMETLIKTARSESDQTKFDDMIKRVIQIAYDDVPSVPIYQPYQYVAMQKRLTGFRYWFHRQMDYRTLAKA